MTTSVEEAELKFVSSSLPPDVFTRYDAITEAWLVVEAKKDAPGVKVIASGGTILVALYKALATVSAHTTA